MYFLLFEKLINKKYYLVKNNLTCFLEKYIYFLFWIKTLFKNCKQIRNVMSFIDFIKFDF